MADLLRFFAIYINNLTFWRDNMKSFPLILLKVVLHVTNKQFSDNFDNCWKNVQNGRFIVFFAFYGNTLTLWAQ